MTKLNPYLVKCGLLDRVTNAIGHLESHAAIDSAKILELLSKYKVIINTRAVGRAGQCDLNKKIIELHAELVKAGHDDDRNQTLLHEVAHAIVQIVFIDWSNAGAFRKVAVHGREWKHVMRLLGASANRCSNLDYLIEARTKKARLIYACMGCETEYPAMRVKKYPANRYRCGKCKDSLYIKKDSNGRVHPNPKNVTPQYRVA